MDEKNSTFFGSIDVPVQQGAENQWFLLLFVGKGVHYRTGRCAEVDSVRGVEYQFSGNGNVVSIPHFPPV